MRDFGAIGFDDRVLRLTDNGGDFEVFVLEYFLEVESELELVRNVARRPDGAIDLFTRAADARCIVECKFVGRVTKTSSRDRWRQVKYRLARNILEAARTIGGAAEAYRPWVEGAREYRFCTSAPGETADARDKLEQQIKAFFVQISKRRASLAHLGSISVKAYFWDDFISHAASCPQLFYRWFGGLPSGINDIAYSFGDPRSFKAFLNTAGLPYFSRREFENSTGATTAGDEAQWAEQLDAAAPGPAAIIYGPGGVGKTRLSIELCKRLKQRGWWPLRLEQYAPTESIAELLRQFSGVARLILFIDYAEQFEQLNRLSELVQRADTNGHRIRLVVSCRASASQRVRDGIANLDPILIDLGRDFSKRMATGYQVWVVSKILERFGIPRASDIGIICGKLPVLAAFAGFLYRNLPAQFERQFGDLVGTSDFLTWAFRRIEALTSVVTEKLAAYEALAAISIQLPMPANEAEEIELTGGFKRELFQALLADHWIEDNGHEYAATHDVLADALLARYIFLTPGLETRRLFSLLRNHQKQSRLSRALGAANRLSSHKEFDRVDGIRLCA